MKKVFAMIAALLIALVGMSVVAVADDSFVGIAPSAVEVTFVETPVVDEVSVEEPVIEEAVVEAPVAIPEVREFTLKYVNWDKEEIMSKPMVEGEVIEELPFLNPVREGFTFEHWYDVKDEEQKPFVFGWGIDKDLELRPFFSEDVIAVVVVEEQWDDQSAQEDAEAPDAQVEQVLVAADETMDIMDNDVDGLEIIIIENPEIDALETADEGAVLIEDDEDDDDMLIIEDDEMEELTMEDSAVPLAGPAMVATDRQVNVLSSLGECVSENETVTLTGELIGFDGCDVVMQWQVFDGANWINIDGATGMEYSFAATSESVNSSYRLAVGLKG